MMQEDKIVATESENVNTTKDLESEISAIMNDKSHPYHVKGHPDHDKSVCKRCLLFLVENLSDYFNLTIIWRDNHVDKYNYSFCTAVFC
jgi:RNase P subunit RPR2